MPRYTPALIILNGVVAEAIGARVEEFICERLGLEHSPPIFQFLQLTNKGNIQNEVAQAYAVALSKRATAESERLLRENIDASRLETYVVAPLQPDSCNLALSISRAVDNCALETVAGGRNAIFLTLKKLLSLQDEELHIAAENLDQAMQAKAFPFNRCFFIDDVNELGETLTLQADIVDLVANFISFAIASNSSDVLRNNPRPYDGAGQHHTAYASFSCNRIRFGKDDLVNGLSEHLARDIAQHSSGKDVLEREFDGLLEPGLLWLSNSFKAVEQQIIAGENGRGNGSNYGSFLDRRFSDMANEKTKNRLSEFTERACQSLQGDLKAFRAFLEQYLECWLIELEAYADSTRRLKREISQVSIKAILDIPSHKTFIDEVPPERKWWHIFVRKKMEPLRVERKAAVLPKDALEEVLVNHATLTKVFDLHLALALGLEAVCINLDLLQQQLATTSEQKFNSIFDFELVDKELIGKFYNSTDYSSKEEDIKGFVSSAEFKRFMDSLFVYPDGNPHQHLLTYCKRRFDFIKTYGIEKICNLRRVFREQKDFLYLSPPFWRPLSNATGEKLVVVACDDQSKFDLKSILDTRNSSTNEVFVTSQDADSISIIQISYGLRLRDVFLFPSSQEGRVDSR